MAAITRYPGHLKFDDNLILYFGSGSEPSGAGDVSISYDGSTWTFTGAITFTAGLTLGDSDLLTFGAGSDLTIQHNGTDNLIDSANATALLRLRTGTDTSATAVQIENNSGNAMLKIDGAGAMTEAALASINLTPSGAITLTGGTTLALSSTSGSAATFSDGVLTLSATSGALSETGLTDLTLTGSGNYNLTAGGTFTATGVGVSTFGDAVAQWSFDGAGAVTEAGMTSLTITPSAGVSITGGTTLALASTSGSAASLSDGVLTLSMTSGALSETGLTTCDLSGSGTMNVTGGGVSTFGDSTGVISFNGSGSVTTSGIGSFQINSVLSTDDGVPGGTARRVGGRAFSSTAASAVITNTTTETAFDQSYTIPADTLKAGTTVRIWGFGTTPSTNSTDQLTIRVDLGADSIITTDAINVENDDIFAFEAVVTIRTAGATGTFVASGHYQDPDAAGTAPKWITTPSTAIDTTTTQLVRVTAEWSVASTANQARLDQLIVDIT